MTEPLQQAAPAEGALPEARVLSTGAAVKGGLIEWFVRGRSIAALVAAKKNVPQGKQVLLAAAEAARELADRTLDPADPLSEGPAPWLAIELYRVAARFCLAALVFPTPAPDLRAGWTAAKDANLLPPPIGAGGGERLEALLFGDSGSDVSLAPPDQEANARELAAFVHALAGRLWEIDDQLGQLYFQRTLRLGLVGVLLFAAALAALILVPRATHPVDLAAGKPGRASSVWTAGYDPATHVVVGSDAPLLFHTEEQESPFYEIDLGAPQPVAAVEAVNREDCCQDRALPLVIALSTDGQTYVEVGRKDRPFDTWRATFAPFPARYVKLSVPRKTVFHLKSVAVYGPSTGS